MHSHSSLHLALDVRSHDYDRFLCIQLAPYPKRVALYAATAFHSELARIAETVSEPLLGHIRLAWWREALEEILAGNTPRNHPVVQALAEIFSSHPEVFTELLKMIEARAADLDATLVAQEEEWFRYLDNTAGALHTVWALLLDADAAKAYAQTIRDQARGYAMIGLARAIPYLQTQGFTRFPEGWAEEEVSALAGRLVLNAENQMEGEPLPRALFALTGLRRLAEYHAEQLRQHGCDPYRITPSKLALVLRILKMKFFLC